jgi:hypothetical protein
MTDKHYFSLEPSKIAVFRAAAQIFSGYVSAGQLTDSNEIDLIRKSITQSITLARSIERIIKGNSETSS